MTGNQVRFDLFIFVAATVFFLAACDQAVTPYESGESAGIEAEVALSDPAEDIGIPGTQLQKVASGVQAQMVPDQYVVVFKSSVHDAPGLARTVVRQQGGSLRHTYDHALKGFSARLPQKAAAALANNPNIAYVEQDQVMQVYANEQTNATWGIDRVDQHALPLSGTYTYAPTGAGVNAYIIDTGIRLNHTEFGGRAVSGYDAIDGGSAEDENGHGTHVAGTIGGATYGVAKDVKLVAVRVLDEYGIGTLSGIIAGVDWVTANHEKPAVVNMSLGGPATGALDEAVRNSIAAGVTYVVAAGNSDRDASKYSPARVEEALTVGASTPSDTRTSFSNYGSVLDLFAPGKDITSAWHTGRRATNTLSGTSMAAPHVAGVAALYLQNNRGASPAKVADAVVSTSTTGALGKIGSGSPNRLLYSLLNTEDSSEEEVVAPCTRCTAYSGNLSGSGDSDFQPQGEYYYSEYGRHKGWLEGPSAANFNLYLYRWSSKSGWTLVAKSETASSDEYISYRGSSGYYTWRVHSKSGSGSYSAWLKWK